MGNACGCVASDFTAIPPQDELANVTNDSEQPSSVDPARYVLITSEVLEGATSNTYGLTDSNINGYATSNGTSYGVTYSHGWSIPSNFTLRMSVSSDTSFTYSQTQTVGTQNETAHTASVTLWTSDANCYEYVDVYEDTTYHTFAYALSQPAPPECQ